MRHAFLLLPVLLSACDEDTDTDTATATEAYRDVTVAFDARLGGQPVACGQQVTGVGTSSSAVEIQDLRFYVHDLYLVDSDGAEVAVVLDDDGVWQDGTVALVDFEDASGLCSNGTAPTSLVVTGQAPEGDYTGLRFTLGVPFELNHADPAAAASPLNLTTMHWSWEGGYKFMRLDLSTAALPEGWFIHIGSTGCEADQDGTITGCSAENRAEVALDIDIDAQSVLLDLDALLAGSDVDANVSGAQGCMSAPDDPECGPLFDALGLSGASQSAFTAE